MFVEQAIFTSVQLDRSAGYQLASRSPGICDGDARALVEWGPAENALIDAGPDAESTNFFPLPSGAYCVSRTTPAGTESNYGGRPPVYTQCLVVSPDVLARFANNPFVILRAAKGAAAIAVHQCIPAVLEPIRVSGSAAVVEVSLLAQLAVNPGPVCMAVLVERALASQRLALVGGPEPDRLIAGLLNCLPVLWRRDFSFSTGLKFSPNRPFRLMRLEHDPAEYRRCVRQANLSLLDVVQATVAAELSGFSGWAGFVAEALATGKTAYLAAQVSRLQLCLSSHELNAQGDHLRRHMHEHNGARNAVGSRGLDDRRPARRAASSGEPVARSADDRESEVKETERQTSRPGPVPIPRDTRQLPAESMSPETQESLEQLDDLVFQAIAGDVEALDELATRWPQMCRDLPVDLVERSREQYLRSALSIWTDCLNEHQRPERAVSALDVLCLLFQQ